MEPEEDLLDFMEKETGGSSFKKSTSSLTFQEKLKADQAKDYDKENDILNKTNYGEDFNDLVTQMDHEGDLLGTQEGIQLNDSDDENIDVDNIENKEHIDEEETDDNKMEIESTSQNRSGQETSQKGPNNDDNTQGSTNITSGEERMAHLLDALDDLSQDIISTPAPITKAINSTPIEPKNSTSDVIGQNISSKIEEDLDIGTQSTKLDPTQKNTDNDVINTKSDNNIAASQSQKSGAIQQRKIFKAKTTKRAPNAIGPGSQDSQNDAFMMDNTSNNIMATSDNNTNVNRKKFIKQSSSGGIQTSNNNNESSAQNQPVNNTVNTPDVNNNNNMNEGDGDNTDDVPPSTQSRALPIWFASKTSIDKQTVTSTKDRQKLKSELRNRLIEGWKNEGFSFTSASSSTSSSAHKGPSQAVINRAPYCEITDDITTVVKGRAVIFDLETSGFSNDDSIIEIGAVEVIDGYRTGVLFQSYAQPRKLVDYRAEAVHLITPQLLQASPPIQFVMASFLQFIGNSPLIAHNAPFDMRFLINEIQRLELSDKFAKRSVFCTQSWFRKKYPNRSYSLNDLAVQFNINLDTRLTQHSALVDAEILSQVITCMLISEKVPKKQQRLLTDVAATQSNANKTSEKTTAAEVTDSANTNNGDGANNLQ